MQYEISNRVQINKDVVYRKFCLRAHKHHVAVYKRELRPQLSSCFKASILFRYVLTELRNVRSSGRDLVTTALHSFVHDHCLLSEL